MGWGRKGLHFPEGLASFRRESVLSIEKPKCRFIFWLYFRNKALTCRLMEDVRLSQSGIWHLGKPGHPLGELLSPLCPDGIKELTTHLVL